MADKPPLQASTASSGGGYQRERDERDLYARLAAMEAKIDTLLKTNERNADRIEALEKERNRMLVYGFLILGAAVVGLASFVVTKLGAKPPIDPPL